MEISPAIFSFFLTLLLFKSCYNCPSNNNFLCVINRVVRQLIMKKKVTCPSFFFFPVRKKVEAKG